LAAASLLTVMTGAIPHSANASPSSLSDLRAQASQLATQINSLGNQEEQLAERYDAALISLGQAEARVAAAKVQVAKDDGDASQAAAALKREAVIAYVDSGTSAPSGTSTSVSSADASLLQAEYEQSMASSQADAQDRYKLTSEVAATAEGKLKAAENVSANTVALIASDKKSINTTVGQLKTAQSQAKGRIATLVEQDRIAAEKAAAAAYQRKLAAERAAAAAAAARAEAARTAATATTQPPATAPPATGGGGGSSGGGGGGSGGGGGGTTPPTTAPPTTTPPTGGETSTATRAVAAAESQVGVPYVWGGASPSQGFDCSGLVMWSYGQAGVSLPHFSGSQYAVTTHISMSDLEPGDLVFPADPGEHVAMYVGNGNIVQAPFTGEDVQVVPISSFFVLASRVS
jgi:cell wall-associated NlpC family hydrolase